MNNCCRLSILCLLLIYACTTPNKLGQNQGGPLGAENPKENVATTESTTKPTTSTEEVPEPVIEVKTKTNTGPSNQLALEDEMLRELNTLRANPSGYIPHVQSYIRRIKSGELAPDPSIAVEVEYAQTLLSTLRQLQPLPQLKTRDDLYSVARKHGQQLQQRNNLMSQNPHEGNDGSQPGDRIDQGAGLDGGENFGTGHESPRDQIVSLLVDAGVPSLGHRNNILDPEWEFVAPYYIGDIGEFDACWLQVFGAEKKIRGGSTASKKAAAVDVSPQNINAVKHAVESAVYLRRPEKEMIHEINRLRANPKAYVSEVEAYIARVRRGEVFTMVAESEEIATAQELIDELRVMEPLSILRPSQKLYEVAMDHGDFLASQGQIDRVNPHKGRNGQGAYDRIKSKTGYSIGGENFVGGKLTAKESVMDLLVDSGIGSKGNRGHRLALLDPAWELVACRHAGTISTSIGVPQNDCWIQNFAKE